MFWGGLIDGVRPDNYDIVGTIIAVFGVDNFLLSKKRRESLVEVTTTIGIFFFAALLEINGGYLVWKWLRDHKTRIFG